MGHLPGWGTAGAEAPQRSGRSTARDVPLHGAAETAQAPRARGSSEEGGWTVVGASARRPRAGARRPPQTAAVPGGEPRCASTCDDTRCLVEAPQLREAGSVAEHARAVASVRQAIQEVDSDGCAATVVAHLCALWGHQQVERVVMLGLGSVSASAPARYQLALGLALARELLNSGVQPLVYDPVFDAQDVTVLAALGCRVISESEAQATYTDASVRGHVLYYMPHCEQFLYDDVLAASVRLRALHRVALLGNSFAEYAARDDLRPAGQRKQEASALLRLQPLVTETALHTARTFPVSAFNSMALHWFTASSAAEALTRLPELV